MALTIVIWTGLVLNTIMTSALPAFTQVALDDKDLRLAADRLVHENNELLMLLEKGLPKSSIPLHLETLQHHVTTLLQFVNNVTYPAIQRDLIQIQEEITLTLQANGDLKLLERRLRMSITHLSTLSHKLIHDYRLTSPVSGVWSALSRHHRSSAGLTTMVYDIGILVCQYPDGSVIIIITVTCHS